MIAAAMERNGEIGVFQEVLPIVMGHLMSNEAAGIARETAVHILMDQSRGALRSSGIKRFQVEGRYTDQSAFQFLRIKLFIKV